MTKNTALLESRPSILTYGAYIGFWWFCLAFFGFVLTFDSQTMPLGIILISFGSSFVLLYFVRSYIIEWFVAAGVLEPDEVDITVYSLDE